MAMTYNESSEWNEKNEMQCLVIFKKLECENFARGKQVEYCQKMAAITKLDVGNISAKISNYKSVAGVNKPSNASKNTKQIYQKYGHLSIAEIESLIVGLR
jgi:hypothetical protein